MAAFLRPLYPGDQVCGGRYTVEELLAGDGSHSLVRLREENLLLKQYALPDPADESLLRELETRSRLEHPNLLPIRETYYEDHHFRLIQTECKGSTLANLLRWKEEAPDSSYWLKLALQLAQLLAFLSTQSDKFLLRLDLDHLMVDGDKLLLVDRGWRALLEGRESGSESAELHYLDQYHQLMGQLLKGLEAKGRSVTSLTWLFNRRYGHLQELLDLLDEECNPGGEKPADQLSPISDFEVPEVPSAPSITELFFQQKTVYLLAEFLVLGLLFLGGAFLCSRPPASLPPNLLYLHSADRILIFDTDQERVLRSWPYSGSALAAWRDPPSLLSLLEESSLLQKLDASTGKARTRILLPTSAPPTRIITTESHFFAVAPGTAVVGQAKPELKVQKALPVGKSCRAFLASGSNIYFADEGFLRRYDASDGQLLAQIPLPYLVDLALVQDRLALIQSQAQEIVLVDAVTLAQVRVIKVAGDVPIKLFADKDALLVFLSDSGDLVKLDEAGSVMARLSPPHIIRDGVSAFQKLWLIEESGELLHFDPVLFELRRIPTKHQIEHITVPR